MDDRQKFADIVGSFRVRSVVKDLVTRFGEDTPIFQCAGRSTAGGIHTDGG